MKAIILAAGSARRMQPLSNDCHKALLPVGGSTILGRIVETLLCMDVSEVVVVTGYRDDDVRAFLHGEFPEAPFAFVHNARYAETNNIVSLSMALDRTKFDEDVLLIECDLLFDPSVLLRLDGDRRGNIALVDHYRPGMDGTVVAVSDGIVTDVYTPQLQGPEFSYADKYKTLNIYRFDRDFCRSTLQPLLKVYGNEIDGSCYYELVLGMLVNMRRNRIAADVVDGSSWAEVDDPNDLAVARFLFEPDRRVDVLDRTLGGHWNFQLLDFSFMRNAYFPTDAMFAAMRQALPSLVRSYGSAQGVLNQKLAWYLRCRPERLQALNGASQIFPMLRELFGGRSALVPSPTFGEYARAFPDARTYFDRPGIDLGCIEEGAEAARVVVFVNPNSPTGTTLPTAWIHDFAARRPEKLVVVDESFVDFSGEEPMRRRLDGEPLPNVLVIESLSKSLGAPGLRLGYAYSCDPELVRALGARLPVWNLGAPAEFLLELLLKFRPELAASLARTIADREELAAALARVELVDEVFPSGGNFLLLRLAGDDPGLGARTRRALLAGSGIDVKEVSGRFAGNGRRSAWLRVAVRRPDENARLIEALGALGSTP